MQKSAVEQFPRPSNDILDILEEERANGKYDRKQRLKFLVEHFRIGEQNDDPFKAPPYLFLELKEDPKTGHPYFYFIKSEGDNTKKIKLSLWELNKLKQMEESLLHRFKGMGLIAKNRRLEQFQLACDGNEIFERQIAQQMEQAFKFFDPNSDDASDNDPSIEPS